MGFLHHREGVSGECVLIRIALAYRGAIESKDPLPNIVGCHGHHGHQPMCNEMALLFHLERWKDVFASLESFWGSID